jgi:hypothetical protein
MSAATVSVDASGSYAAVVDDEFANADGDPHVAVLDLDDGATRTISEPGESAIAYMGEHLLIQQPSGTLQVWNSAGSALEQTLSAVPTDALAPDGLDTLDAQDWMHVACGSAGLDITAQQWQQYAGTSAPSGLTCPG